jgi:diguanylate cyclase (GGDEF)-like protein/PAS domain S-box-containing protein
MRKKSLKDFLFYRIVLMVIVPMFIISCVSIFISVNSIKERIERRNTALRNIFNYSVNHYEESLSKIGNLLLEMDIDEFGTEHDLEIMEKTNHNFDKLQILNLEGIVKYSSQGEGCIGIDMSNFEFVEKATIEDGFFWSKVMKSLKDQNSEIMIAKRFKSGILVGSIDVKTFGSLVTETVKGTGSRVAILDADGEIIISNLKEIVPKIETSYDYVYKSENQEMQKRSFIEGRKKLDIIQSYGKVKKTGWDVVIIEETSKGFILAWDFYRHIVLGMLALTLGIIYVSYFLMEKLSGDIKKLNIMSEKVFLGELPKMMEYEISEAEELAQRFLLMGEVVLEREENIKEKAGFLENLLETIPNPVFYKDKNHVYLGGNKAFADYLGLEKHEFLGKTVYDVAPKGMAEIYKEADDRILEAGTTQIYETQVMAAGENIKDVKFYKSVFRNLEGKKSGIIGVILDVTSLKEAVRMAEKKERLIESLLNTVPLPTFYQDINGLYINCNKAFEEIVNKGKNEIIGKCHLEVWAGNFTEYCNVQDEKIFKEEKSQKFEYTIINKNGENRSVIFDKAVFYNEDGKVAGIVGVISDITEIRKMQNELKNLSLKDSLTGIYNRRGFEEMSNKVLKESSRNKDYVSIIMIDIDDFKLYNDHYGHQAGDRCLIQISEKLENSCRRPLDIVARYGGEEFIVFLPNTDLKGAKIVAEKINKNIQEMKIEHVKSKHGGVVTVSLGVASEIPKDELSREKLTGFADKMLYLAKDKGKNRVEG